MSAKNYWRSQTEAFSAAARRLRTGDFRDYGTATWDGGESSCDHRVPASGSTQNKGNNNREGTPFIGDCGKCGARRIDSQIGLESTPDAYVAALVAVFADVRRVLKDDGVLWLNLGDSYSGSGKGGNPDEGKQSTNKGSQSIGVLYGKTGETAREAALTNVSRRWTTEQGIAPKNLVGIPWRVAFALQADGWYLRSDIIWHKPNPMPESVTDRPTTDHEHIFLLAKARRYFYDAKAIEEVGVIAAGTRAAKGSNVRSELKDVNGRPPEYWDYTGTRNARSVWTINTQNYDGAHFATFPEALPERCIKAGSRLGDTVLDPFTGSGTTGQVAIQLGRSFVGIELNPAYAALARTRIGNAAPLFAEQIA